MTVPKPRMPLLCAAVLAALGHGAALAQTAEAAAQAPRRIDFAAEQTMPPPPPVIAPYQHGPQRRIDFAAPLAPPKPPTARPPYVHGPPRRIDFSAERTP